MPTFIRDVFEGHAVWSTVELKDKHETHNLCGYCTESHTSCAFAASINLMRDTGITAAIYKCPYFRSKE